MKSLGFSLWLVVALVFAPQLVLAQDARGATSDFGSCAYWQDRERPRDELYMIGLAHGLVLGIAAAPHTYVTGANDFLSTSIIQMYDRGWSSLLERPAVLMDALDAKCSDYRNRSIDLEDVTFLAILEMGGASASQIEGAFELLRLRSDAAASDRRRAMVRLLVSPN